MMYHQNKEHLYKHCNHTSVSLMMNLTFIVHLQLCQGFSVLALAVFQRLLKEIEDSLHCLIIEQQCE